jgi:hypothetical protein
MPFERKSETRFRISLIFLMAGLLLSAFILILTLISAQNNQTMARTFTPVNAGAKTSAKFSANPILEDPSLDFTLKIPTQLGQWLYKTGFVKSLVNETLSDRYVTIFIPRNAKTGTNNFDDLTQDILIVRQFVKEEWKKLETGCGKGNQIYCEAMGEKIGEKNDAVWAYTKAKTCPKDIEAKCSLADKIAETFTLK